MSAQFCVMRGDQLSDRIISQARHAFPGFTKVLFIAYHNNLALPGIWSVHIRDVPLRHNDRLCFVNDTRAGMTITDILTDIGGAFIVTADVDDLISLCREKGIETFEYVPIQPEADEQKIDLSDRLTHPMGSSG